MNRDLANIFEPDTVLPTQFLDRFAGGGPVESEKRLMLAVLEDAVDCCQRYALAKSHRARRQYDEAREWIESTDTDWPYSFENICSVLDLDAAAIRAELLEKGPARVVRRERIQPRIVPLADRRERGREDRTGVAA